MFNGISCFINLKKEKDAKTHEKCSKKRKKNLQGMNVLLTAYVSYIWWECNVPPAKTFFLTLSLFNDVKKNFNSSFPIRTGLR